MGDLPQYAGNRNVRPTSRNTTCSGPSSTSCQRRPSRTAIRLCGVSRSMKSSWASGLSGAGRADGQDRARSRSATAAGSAVSNQSRSAFTVSVS